MTKKLLLSLSALLALILTGCVSTGETAQRDQVTENIDNFSPPPSGVDRPQVGVPPFETSDKDIFGYSVSGNELSQIAADQMTTMLFKTRRFRVIERAQFNQLLREQNLEGVVRQDELAQMGKVRGVDYLVLGKITNFRLKREDTSTNYGVGGRVSRELLDGISGGFRKSGTRITTEVGVDIRLVDPETGEVKMAEFSEYERTDTAESMGIRVAGIGAGGNANVQVGEDDAGQVLRLAFADALKKAMPQIDQVLREEHRSGSSGGSAGTPAESSGGAAKFCSSCGTKVAADAKFCPKDGTQLTGN
jgi:curli biogenesis system outer membrane secretion channel CsgG